MESNGLKLVFADQNAECYRVGGDYLNRYYIISDSESGRLMNCPEVVGFDVYRALLNSTSLALKFLSAKGEIQRANILTILRGGLNYPLEEACYSSGIRVYDMSFVSSERVMDGARNILGLEIKYEKLALIDDSTLLIGDIIASGDTMVHCFKYLIDSYRKSGKKLKNVIFFTIGGTEGIELMEKMTAEYREFWPDFEGFTLIYFGGVFYNYQDKGVTGIQIRNIDFYWANGIIAPGYRKQTLETGYALFEKCTIYDGGARRYEIAEHIKEVREYWQDILRLSDQIDFEKLKEEKLGYPLPIGFEDWLVCNHYQELDRDLMKRLYELEVRYLEDLKDVDLRKIAESRLSEFNTAMQVYEN